MRDGLKVGVFLCECGGNIADVVDLDKVKEELDVEFIGQFENLCSLNGRKIIRDAIFDHDLDRVVVAACSPISHEKTFQDYVKPLNPYFSITNIAFILCSVLLYGIHSATFLLLP